MRIKVIIIHINERTVDLSRRIAEREGDVYLISERPFARSLRRAFAKAINSKWEWMVLMGGDQLLQEGALTLLQREADNAEKNVFRISGYGYDKLLMGERMMAPSIYRVRFLSEALKLKWDNQRQPESFVFHAMKRKGHKNTILNDSLAVHDTCQYYRDIYRKGYSEASKIMNYIEKNNIIMKLQKSKIPDHKLFLFGILDFINDTQRTPQEAMNILGLKEKRKL